MAVQKNTINRGFDTFYAVVPIFLRPSVVIVGFCDVLPRT